ncbi:zinc ribbon domain-containing protein [Pyrobaculum sp.]|uniref:zinc ribbon domain-containing protein n=1 Tax=Pyrobaculum sp. TaxID=2004705 RepID=UPI003D14D610
MGCFAALGIDVNKSYVAFSWVTNDPDLAASALGAWGAHPITSWLFEEHLAFKTPLKLSEAVSVPEAHVEAVLMWLPGRRNNRQKRWRRMATTKLFATLTPWLRHLADQGTPAVIGVEDLRGMARRRGISEVEYAKIWKKIIGAFGTPLREGPGYRAYIGRGRSIVIALDPRGTSATCALCAAQGRTTPVQERGGRTVHCPIHGPINRDINAAINIAIKAVRIYAGDTPGGARGGQQPQPRTPSAGHPNEEKGAQRPRGDETAENRLEAHTAASLTAPPGALDAYMEEVFKHFAGAEGRCLPLEGGQAQVEGEEEGGALNKGARTPPFSRHVGP